MNPCSRSQLASAVVANCLRVSPINLSSNNGGPRTYIVGYTNRSNEFHCHLRPEVSSALIPEPEALSPITNPGAAVQAVMNSFDERHISSQDEFFRILRRSQNSGR